MFDENGMCFCGVCKNVFRYSERKMVKGYGIPTPIAACPKCKSLGFTHSSHRRWLEKKYESLNN